MAASPTGPLIAASHVQGMAEKAEGKLAFVLTGLSCLLVAKMVWDQFGFLQGRENYSHVQRLNAARIDSELERRYPTPGDRRR